MKPIKVKLRSNGLIHAPGILKAWLHMAQTGDRLVAFYQMNGAYPQLPASLIIDLIDGRLNGLVFDDTVEFPLWEGPQSKDAED